MIFIYTLHALSILLELIAAILGVKLAVSKEKSYGWCIALTFLIWVFYDTINFLSVLNLAYLVIPMNILYLLFFVATASILYAIWRVYKES